MSNQFRDQLSLLQKVNQLAKASAQWPDPEGSDDDQSLDDYLTSLVDPDDPDPDSSSTSALRDSALVGLHLAKAKLSVLQKDHVKVHQALNKAMAFHARLHGQINRAAAASEFDPNDLRRKEQEEN
jgi:hypothetical protein